MKNSVDEATCMCTSTISEPETGKVSSTKPTQKGKNVLQKSPIRVPGMSYEITLTDIMNVTSSNHFVVLFLRSAPPLYGAIVFAGNIYKSPLFISRIPKMFSVPRLVSAPLNPGYKFELF